MTRSRIEAPDMLMRQTPDTHLFVERVRCFIKWHAGRFDALDKPHEPISDPVGWTRRDEVWIKQAVWRDTIFDGDGDEAMSASCALRDLDLLRVQDRGNCAALVNIRGKPCRAYVVLPAISEWRPCNGGRNGNNGFVQLEPVGGDTALIPHAINGLTNDAPPDLAALLEAASRLGLEKAITILGMQLDPESRHFQTLLRAQTALVSTALTAQVKVDEVRLQSNRREEQLPKLLEKIAAALKEP
jgi:hypothetical protein